MGTYKDQSGTEKSWQDSIEHTCVWKPKKNGNDTTGMGWMKSTKNDTWQENCKPSKGGGVFSFRAGHMDLHPVFISRKQPRDQDYDFNGTNKANSRLIADYRMWNPTIPWTTQIHFVAAHEYVAVDGVVPDNKKHGCLDVGGIGASGDIKTSTTMHCDDLYVHNIVDRGGRGGWVTIKSNVQVGWNEGKRHLKVHGGLTLPAVRRNEAGRNPSGPELGYGWLYRTGNNDEVKIWDGN